MKKYRELFLSPEKHYYFLYNKGQDIKNTPFIRNNGKLFNKIFQNNPEKIGQGKIGAVFFWEDKIVKLSLIKKEVFYQKITSPSSILSLPSSLPHQNCFFNLSPEIHLLGLDEFANETLIGFYLAWILRKNKLPAFTVTYYSAFTWNNQGLQIMEHCDLGTLYSPKIIMTTENLKIAVNQVLLALHYLQTLAAFTSGDLKLDNIFLSSQGTPFLCKIADYGKSSCSINTLRIYNYNKASDIYLSFFPFEPEIKRKENVNTYKIRSFSNLQLYNYTRHMGIPYYRTLDQYTFLVSMALRYPEMLEDQDIKELWGSLWLQKDQKKVEQKLSLFRNRGKSINDALDFLRGLNLKCSS